MTSIFCGILHSIVLTNSHQCFSWGNNENGQLGLGEQIKKTDTPTLIEDLPLVCYFLNFFSFQKSKNEKGEESCKRKWKSSFSSCDE